LVAVSRTGYALDRGEESDSYRCAAAPVFNHRGEAVAALWISGPADRLPAARLAEQGTRVKRHAGELSRRLGFEISPED
jgi:IclR family acetate operon transcriptional repressor